MILVRAVMIFAAKRGWCERPFFELPRIPKSEKTHIEPIYPADMRRIIEHAAPHAKPLFTFFACTGARCSEAIDLDWKYVDLDGCKVTLIDTKNGRDRLVDLPPAAVEALRALPYRTGRVFRWQRAARPVRQQRLLEEAKRRADHMEEHLRRLQAVATRGGGKRLQRIAERLKELRAEEQRRAAAIAEPVWVEYKDREREEGGQVRKAWKTALRRAGFADRHWPGVHTLRHSWASWHYAIHKDPLKLMRDGDWSGLDLVERYAHLLHAGHEQDIQVFWHGCVTKIADKSATHWNDNIKTAAD